MVDTVDGIKLFTDAAEACRLLDSDELIGFDTETTGLSPQLDNVALLQLYGDTTGTLAVIQSPNGIIPPALVDLLKDPRHLFIGHNVVNFDLAFLNYAGVEWDRSRWYDTLVAETVLATTGRRDVSVSLRESVRRRLGLKIDKDITHGNWAAEELTEAQISYAARDVISLPALYRAQWEKAKEQGSEEALAMEMELMPYVAMMYINGLPLRRDILSAFMDGQRLEADKYEVPLRRDLGNINLNSTHQLRAAIAKKTNVVLTSTAKEVLVDYLSDDAYEPAWSILENLLAYRAPGQLLKMYTPEWMDKFIIANRVHSRFWQCSADTSRFTSSGPNLQQWPKVMRKTIGNIDGYKVVAADYSQIEVRIAAAMAHDVRLLQTLEEGDVHRGVATDVYKIPADQISGQQRKNAKALTFALLFDGTAMTLYRHSRENGGLLTYNECVGLERLFFETYTGLQEARQKARIRAQRPGVVVIKLPNGLRRVLAGRNKRASTILNTMVQGTAAVGIKYGILEAGRQGLVKYFMGAQVHDELVATVPDQMADEYGRDLEHCMIVGMSKVLPNLVRVETKINNFWET